MATKCPWCRNDIEDQLAVDENWDEPGFDTNCPVCSKPLDVVVEPKEYEYWARKGVENEVSEGES